ncbi:SDR family oxidoreductase [Mycolicibacterium arenosum]|uniref:SDR family oxidoreductase n=1 Tax=Mycolicibacterium arenosum TaxID=2952157 RepID=A0ABT1MB78_9MYCO|nr:SDR family oxidoreductase [Mycolicibacterium sp. CAU 1645]MCP9276415.1 SDR family oxidoreductase [Mycolicibacterium sp. CAU 1645]
MTEAHIVESSRRTVVSADGTRIAVYEEGDPSGPVLVLVHGWPDSHVVWDGVVPLLADRFRIIRYDNRGVGGSAVPKDVSAFAMARFADDFAAVIDAVAPGERVHVLAHDWGSTGIWEYLARPEATDRIASFTSTSGPSSDHLNRFVMTGLATPYRPVRFARSAATMGRLAYMGVFALPVLPPLLVRLTLRRTLTRMLERRDDIPADRIHHSPDQITDAVNSMKVYRANFAKSLTSARTDHHVDVPVQMIVNTRDPFVGHHVYDEVRNWVPRLWRRDIRAGHWSPFSHPRVLADAVTELVDHLEGKPASRTLLRAQVGRPRERFGDTLVSVTGAGSGIGRETALLFARLGAEVVVSDLDEAGVEKTAADIAERGGTAHSYVLDVSDAQAVEEFAEMVCREHGVPDVVVNNAGIGQAGSFLDTPAEEWDRVLDVNLGGVVNGCRSFAGRMVDRGLGGHVVNVSSMAAYSPLQAMNAYCTSKAAVYMFSDCLRAELDAAGIGLTTICPGVINTNIIHTTRWNPPEHKAGAVAARRKQVATGFNARSYGPERVAKAIVESVVKNKAIRPVAPEAYLLYGTSRVAPQIMRSAARQKLI